MWPEHLFPLQPVGRLVLNQNPSNFFNENEQLAFSPALVVPGAPLLYAMSCFGAMPARPEMEHS